jgi:hypothetical protein
MYSLRIWHRDTDGDPSASVSAPKSRRSIDLVGWITVVWVAWWSWAYLQSAVLHRFPQLRIRAAASSSSDSLRSSPQSVTPVPRKEPQA